MADTRNWFKTACNCYLPYVTRQKYRTTFDFQSYTEASKLLQNYMAILA
jgi:hypothetical protein